MKGIVKSMYYIGTKSYQIKIQRMNRRKPLVILYNDTNTSNHPMLYEPLRYYSSTTNNHVRVKLNFSVHVCFGVMGLVSRVLKIYIICFSYVQPLIYSNDKILTLLT